MFNLTDGGATFIATLLLLVDLSNLVFDIRQYGHVTAISILALTVALTLFILVCRVAYRNKRNKAR